MKILLTGATGFIGRYVEDLLGNSCRSVYRCQNYEPCTQDVFYINSINKDAIWKGAFENCKAVIHLAGIAHSNTSTEQDYFDINTEGTIHLATEAVRAGVKRFVFVSSVNVCGSCSFSEPIGNYTKPKPSSLAAKSKLRAEIGLKKLSSETGLEVVIVRPTLVYGPKAPGNLGMLSKLINKMPLLPFGMANNRRNFISVQNLAELLVVCALHENAAGHVFFASESEPISIKKFTNAIATAQGKKIFQAPIPVGLMHLLGRLTGKSVIIDQLFGNLEVDSSNLKDILNWFPPHTMKECMRSLYEQEK